MCICAVYVYIERERGETYEADGLCNVGCKHALAFAVDQLQYIYIYIYTSIYIYIYISVYISISLLSIYI